MRNNKIKQLISRSQSIESANKYLFFKLDDTAPLIESAQHIMSKIEQRFGDCVALSATWAYLLNKHYSIPAIVVAGDLKVDGVRVFKCKRNLPDTAKNVGGAKRWDGHCWIEIDGYIGDLSVINTARSIRNPSRLKDFIQHNFPAWQDTIFCSPQNLPQGIEYTPRFVLNNNQLNIMKYPI